MRLVNAAATLLAGLSLTACATYADNSQALPENLIGGEWLVEDINARGVIDRARTTISFAADGNISGDTACNRYFARYDVNGNALEIADAGATRRACPPAVMDQESRFLEALANVNGYLVDDTGALKLTGTDGTSITARRTSAPTTTVNYRCSDGSIVEAIYPTTDTAQIVHDGRTVQMTSAVSASGARYVGGGLQWWTTGASEGMLSPLADGEDIASARGIDCRAQ